MKHVGPQTAKNPLRNASGFTLVEIIAVLVILGILAAVAVPKYYELQENAKSKALDGAIAEVVGRVNQHFAKSILEGVAVASIKYNATTLGSTDLGDFTLNSVVLAGDTLTITVQGNNGTAVAGATKSRDIQRPKGF
ncbi:MAG: prepilin-type N-terminal cleavage/methylation domain-containing protein [Desulfobacteraceae bacterium]|nr:prepilin-type N-terminal cleavage/methylation domain-containing protein [Desulfobacteraceae bacterium]